MDRLSKLVAAAALSLGASAAHAFVFPQPPPGFGGTPAGGWTFAPPPASKQVDMIIRQSKGLTLNLPGAGKVSMDVAYKLGPQAKRAAAFAIFASPQLRTAVGIASWLGVGKILWDEVEGQWTTTVRSEETEGFIYVVPGGTTSDPSSWCKSKFPNSVYKQISQSEGACAHPSTNGTYATIYRTCPPGTTFTPAGCLLPPIDKPRPLTTPEEFADQLAPKPMPETVPGELPPGTALPIGDPPVINPSPGPNPQHQPKFVPTGDPVPNPQHDPANPQSQPFTQPGVKINPSPTLAEPFRLDVKPVERPQDSPDPQPEPGPNDPAETGSNDQVKPEELQSLCEKHPDILACAKMDEPHEEELPQEEKPIEITPDSGWGAGGASCPAPKMISVQGRQIAVPFDLFCKYMDGMRPIILAMAWLSAAFILVGAREGS